MEDLNGRVVLVTGAARRIGRGIALYLANRGARVAIHYSASRAEAEQTAAECGGAPLFGANLESVAEIEQLFAAVHRHFGRLDALVNNAARFTKIDPLEVTEADQATKATRTGSSTRALRIVATPLLIAASSSASSRPSPFARLSITACVRLHQREAVSMHWL